MEATLRCPSCRIPVSWDGNPHRPFCSERCRLIDLGSWASGTYRIPVVDEAEPVTDSDDESEPS
jgi:uncharacterized protein